MSYAVYLQMFQHGEPFGVSRHAVEAVLGRYGTVEQRAGAWSLDLRIWPKK